MTSVRERKYCPLLKSTVVDTRDGTEITESENLKEGVGAKTLSLQWPLYSKAKYSKVQ
jgi:hypothetical protein